MKNIDQFKKTLTESFKELLIDSPKSIDNVLKEDFIRDFIVAFLTKQKNAAVEREMQKLKKTNPEYYNAIKDWDRRNEVLLKQMSSTFPKVSKAPGPYDKMASSEWTKKSMWRMGGN